MKPKKKCMAKVNISVNYPNNTIWQKVKVESPLEGTLLQVEALIYSTIPSNPQYVQTKLTTLRGLHPTLQFESSNPGGSPPNPPGT